VSYKDEMYRIGENGTEPPVGSVIAYRVKLGGRDYDYVSLRAGNGLWYSTGSGTPQGVDWDALSNAMKYQGVERYSVAVEWERKVLR